MTEMRGNLKIHKSDGITRSADKVKILPDGAIAVWDNIDTTGFVESGPDVIASSDKWERVEREDHSWRRSSTSNIIQEAKDRDDVDADDVTDIIR